MTKTSRRRWMIGASAAASAAVADGFVIEPNWLDVSRHEIHLEGLPRGLDGFTIAQVTDAHLTGLGRVEEAIVSVLRAADVQLCALTGDIIEAAEHLDVLREFCSGLKTPGMQILATLGNWEHYGAIPLQALSVAYADSGARLLINEALELADGVRVFAADDLTMGRPRMRQLYDARGDTDVLLTHSPALLDRIPAIPGRELLSLAGHTHGGQVRLGQKAVPVLPRGSGRFVAGWYDVPTGKAFVSRGTGTSGLPVRFTCRPELPLIQLRRA